MLTFDHHPDDHRFTAYRAQRLGHEVGSLAFDLHVEEQRPWPCAVNEALDLWPELEDYADEWDREAYRKGNRDGLPF